MLKIKEKESYKAVMKKAFWKKVINNIIIFFVGLFYNNRTFNVNFREIKMKLKELIEKLKKT